jgi:hypothetical protein
MMRQRIVRTASTFLACRGLIALAICCCAACSPGDRDRTAIRASLADPATDPLEFYATQSPTTDPREYRRLLAGVPADPAGIVRIVQNVLVRADLIESGAHPIPDRRFDREVDIRTVHGMLERIAEIDDRPLTETRERRDRLVVICAQHAMLTAALFRHHGIPARPRGGFETYFSKTKHHDHWIAEFWNAEDARWVRVDAEIEKGARDHRGKEINGLDLPAGTFLTGAEAWRKCRFAGESPLHFGISGGEWYGGWDFVLNELLLDFNALNKVESLPWDETEQTERGYEKLSGHDLALLDRMSEAVSEGDAAFERVRDLFRSNPDLRKRR